MKLEAIGVPLLMGMSGLFALGAFFLLVCFARWSHRALGLVGLYWLVASIVATRLISLATSQSHAWMVDEVLTPRLLSSLTVAQYSLLWGYATLLMDSLAGLVLIAAISGEFIRRLSTDESELGPVTARLCALGGSVNQLGLSAVVMGVSLHMAQLGLWSFWFVQA